MIINLRPARLSDIRTITLIHMESFRGFFLTNLGTGFLHELYNGFLKDSLGILVVAEMDGVIVGFAAGCIKPEKFFQKLRNRRWPYFLFSAIPMVCRQPVFVIKKLFEALFYSGESPCQINDGVLLSSLAVAPSWAGKGVGKKLVLEFVEKAETLGGKSVYVITDTIDNDAVNSFYRNVDFLVESTFSKTGNRQMNRLIKYIS